MAANADPQSARRPQFTPHPTAAEAFDQADSMWAWVDKMNAETDRGRMREWLETATEPPAKVTLAMACQQRAAMQEIKAELATKASSEEVSRLPAQFAAAAFEYQGTIKTEEEETKRNEKAEEEKTRRTRHVCVSGFLERLANTPGAILLIIMVLGAALILTIGGVLYSDTNVEIGSDGVKAHASDVADPQESPRP